MPGRKTTQTSSVSFVRIYDILFCSKRLIFYDINSDLQRWPLQVTPELFIIPAIIEELIIS